MDALLIHVIHMCTQTLNAAVVSADKHAWGRILPVIVEETGFGWNAVDCQELAYTIPPDEAKKEDGEDEVDDLDAEQDGLQSLVILFTEHE
jgi:hypothetical protein